MTLRAKISHIFTTVLLACAVLVIPVSAQGFGTTLQSGLNAAAPAELKGVNDPTVIIGNMVSAIIGVFGAALFVYLLWGGFKYMTAAGDSKKVEEGIATIRNAIIGIIIISLSYAISAYVLDKLTSATSNQGQGQVQET